MAKKLELDFDIYRWKLGERILFEKVTGMTCERAVSMFAAAADDDEAALDVPAAVQAGFVWIAARRQNPGITFEAAADLYNGQDFLDAIPEPPEDETPLVNRARRRSTKKSAAASATTSTTPPSKSET